MGQCRKIRPLRPVLPLELETRNGLSLARNDVATIAGSVFLACPFVPTLEFSANPFGPKLSTRFGFEADTGRIRHSEPVARDQSSAHATPSRLHSPSGFCTLRIEAFDRSHRMKLA
jgi:hypothetical protein